jgi:serine/threonine protein kinase
MEADALNEIRAVEKLCSQGYQNIVTVLRIFQFGNSHVIDMEYCESTLKDYIDNFSSFIEKWPIVDLGDHYNDNAKKWSRIGKIMRDVLSGLAFIHSNREIHRDLKPCNGLSSIHALLKISLVFTSDRRSSLENSRFWVHGRGFIKKNDHQFHRQRHFRLPGS